MIVGDRGAPNLSHQLRLIHSFNLFLRSGQMEDEGTSETGYARSPGYGRRRLDSCQSYREPTARGLVLWPLIGGIMGD